MVSLIEKICPKVIVHEIKGIERCFEYKNPAENDTSVRFYGKLTNIDCGFAKI